MEYENMRMPELKSLARECRLRGYSRMRKAELVTSLQMFCTIFLERNQMLIIFNSWRGPVINELRKKYSSRPVATMRQVRQLPHLKFPKKICLR